MITISRHIRPSGPIYHCSVQKAASQWFRLLLSDPIICRSTRLQPETPPKDFLFNPDGKEIDELGLARPAIWTPLYMRYDDLVARAPNNQRWRAFFILRDPRDLVVSYYFSMRDSHVDQDPYVAEKRRRFADLDKHTALHESIEDIIPKFSEVMTEWQTAAERDKRIAVFRFEDIFGADKERWTGELFQHCNIRLTKKQHKHLLQHYSFKQLTGRKPGQTDTKHHLRSGTSGDWKNHLDESHLDAIETTSPGFLAAINYA